MNTQEKNQMQNNLKLTNILLITIVVLLTIGLIMDVLIYSSMTDLPNDIHYGLEAIYNRMGRMRVY